MRILYAEDHPKVREVTIRAMMRLGHEVTAVSNGKELLEKLYEGGVYDAVVTDYDMPEMNGLDALSKIRSDPQFEKLPVIVCSGQAALLRGPTFTELGGECVDKTRTEELRAALGRIASALDPDRPL